MKFKNYLNEGKSIIKTRKDKTGHSHEGIVNADGDGKTINTQGKASPHEHNIKQWLIQPAKGHIHDLED